jgi:hypothetical protein
MTTQIRNDADPRQAERTETRRALIALAVPVFFVIMFSACIIGTYHKPHLNGIKVGLVGPAALTAPLRAKLETAAGSAFEISQVATVDEATHDVRNRDLDAAFVPTADPTVPATLIVATAGGRITATAAETLARFITTAQGSQLDVRDVRPLVDGDAIGVGIFLYMVICTIAGYLAATVLYTVTPDLAPARRYAMLAGIAIVAPTLTYLIGGAGFGAYSGSAGTIVAFIGIGALYTLVVSLITRLLQVLLGPVAIFVSLAIFVFINIPSLGATYTRTTLPSAWRFLNGFWIGAETVNAERSLLYFEASGVGTDLVRLLAWTCSVTILLLLPLLRKLEHQRTHPAATTATGSSRPVPLQVHAVPDQLARTDRVRRG